MIKEVKIKFKESHHVAEVCNIMNKYENLEFDIGSSNSSMIDGKSPLAMINMIKSNTKCNIIYDKKNKSDVDNFLLDIKDFIIK